MSYIAEIFSSSFFTIPNFPRNGKTGLTFFLTGIFLIVEWFGREDQYSIELLGAKWPKIFRWIMYYSIIAAIMYLGGNVQEFIYFQF